jgi:hypothetical protein
MTPYIATSRTSAEIITSKFTFYYGDRFTDFAGEWMFVVIKNNKEVFSKSNSELLSIASGEGPVDMLLAGIALFFS